MREESLIGDTPRATRRGKRRKGVQGDGKLAKHATLSDINGLVSLDFIRSAFCFCLVRNPWDRMVSYYHWLRAQEFEHPAVARAQALGFGPFLRDEMTRATIGASDYGRYMTACDGAEHAQAFIRLEHFDRDSALLWAHLGFTLKLPHENRSERRPEYRSYYTDSDAELVSTLCAKDIQRFGYAF